MSLKDKSMLVFRKGAAIWVRPDDPESKHQCRRRIVLDLVEGRCAQAPCHIPKRPGILAC